MQQILTLPILYLYIGPLQVLGHLGCKFGREKQVQNYGDPLNSWRGSSLPTDVATVSWGGIKAMSFEVSSSAFSK